MCHDNEKSCHTLRELPEKKVSSVIASLQIYQIHKEDLSRNRSASSDTPQPGEMLLTTLLLSWPAQFASLDNLESPAQGGTNHPMEWTLLHQAH